MKTGKWIIGLGAIFVPLLLMVLLCSPLHVMGIPQLSMTVTFRQCPLLRPVVELRNKSGHVVAKRTVRDTVRRDDISVLYCPGEKPAIAVNSGDQDWLWILGRDWEPDQ